MLFILDNVVLCRCLQGRLHSASAGMLPCWRRCHSNHPLRSASRRRAWHERDLTKRASFPKKIYTGQRATSLFDLLFFFVLASQHCQGRCLPGVPNHCCDVWSLNYCFETLIIFFFLDVCDLWCLRTDWANLWSRAKIPPENFSLFSIWIVQGKAR